MCSSLGWALSDMADAVVVGQRIGTVGLAAIALILPVYMINCMFAHGLGLGGSIRFRDYEFTLEKGGALFVYTDGVAEATDAHDELFGTERTLEALNQNPDASPRELLTNVKGAVDRFVGEAPQFDDLTMLSVKRN